MQKLEKRWERRRIEEGLHSDATADEWTLAEGSIDIASPREAVWDFLTTPESLLLVNESIDKVFRVPDTPVVAPGEQVCLVFNAGEVTASIIETVAVERPSTIITKLITGPVKAIERIEVHDLRGVGTQMKVQHGVDRLPTRKSRVAVQAHLDQFLRRTRAALESGARFS